MPDTATLPSLTDQAERLITLGIAERAGLEPDRLRAAVGSADTATYADALLVIREHLAPASSLAAHVTLGDRQAFVVTDMTDVDEFAPIDGLEVPSTDVYLLTGLDRGDHLANWSPDEALPEITGQGRTPLTLAEGLHWLVQGPETLERNHCFMTVGSRLCKPNGRLDARTPALWISNGTGRDGAANRHAPKVGWCWAGNRHTWLGFASAEGRVSIG